MTATLELRPSDATCACGCEVPVKPGRTYVHGHNARRPDTQQRIREVTRVTESGCWEATGYLREDGYGEINVNGKKQLLHRASYEAFVGPIPEGLDIDHVCRNRACANPAADHLEPVTRAENLRRGLGNKPRAECSKGHPMSGENLKLSGGHRACRICANERNRRYYETHREEILRKGREIHHPRRAQRAIS